MFNVGSKRILDDDDDDNDDEDQDDDDDDDDDEEEADVIWRNIRLLNEH